MRCPREKPNRTDPSSFSPSFDTQRQIFLHKLYDIVKFSNNNIL